MKVRVKFAKYGVLRFIGHLDVMRFFQKALRRADIDVAYTGGFSPHQIMSFASPLGVGMCSMGEYMDIEVNSHQGAADMQARLQAACPEGIRICSIKALPKEAGNAMASVAAATYAVACKEEGRDFTDYGQAVAALLEQDEILITKETKKSTLTVNIRPGIYDLHIEDGHLVFTVDASSAGNIKPSFVIEQFLQRAGLSIAPIYLQVFRMEIYTNTGTADMPVLTPLEEMGEDF